VGVVCEECICVYVCLGDVGVVCVECICVFVGCGGGVCGMYMCVCVCVCVCVCELIRRAVLVGVQALCVCAFVGVWVCAGIVYMSVCVGVCVCGMWVSSVGQLCCSFSIKEQNQVVNNN